MNRSWVIIYRHFLLPFSETFIREQAEHLEGFRPFYVGLQKNEEIGLPPERLAVLDTKTWQGKMSAAVFLTLGRNRPLLQRLRALKPSLIHAHFEGGGIAALGLAKVLRIPLVVTCHGFDVTMTDESRWPNPLLRRLYKFARRRLHRKARLFIAVSQHIKRCMLAKGYPEERLMVHYIGVDCRVFCPDSQTVREPIVLFVGRLVEKKGCAYLIRAMQTVQQTHPGIRLVIVGDGPLRHDLQALADELGVPAEFPGVQTVAGVKDWMNKAQVLCLPALRAANGDMDGCCMVLAEAQAMGLPVVAFATGGTPEAVCHRQTGLLVPERDQDQLAHSILSLINDPALWQQFSDAARAHVLENFNLAKQNNRLEEIYRQLTNITDRCDFQ